MITTGIEYCQLITSPTGESCFHDGVGAYGGNEHCVIQAVRGLYATATMYDIDSGRDYVSINGNAFTLRNTGPFNVWMNAGETMQWQSDSTVARQGFIICASQSMASTSTQPSPMPSPSPPSCALLPSTEKAAAGCPRGQFSRHA